ncbi:MAG: hypothetical protein H6839_10335 [Planctomycetes bacterium]|nr:hypothetical protein [Planctomycetota bacterium]
MEFINDAWNFLSNVHWGRVAVVVIFTLIAVVLGIWFPARMLEEHTNQPLAKPIWYFVGTVALVMIYISMYGYGHFWDLYADSPESQQVAPISSEE